MTDTAQLGLPLLQPAQAQKHVTVNEALARLDALTAMVLVSRSQTAPPSEAAEGEVWAVPADAAGAWSGRDGTLAIRANGGWAFLPPRRGWRVWIADESVEAHWNGFAWEHGVACMGVSGLVTKFDLFEVVVDLTPGSVFSFDTSLGTDTVVVGASGVVLETLTGSLTSWSVGAGFNATRHAGDIGLEVGASFARAYVPMLASAEPSIRISSNGGNFATGRVAIALHLLKIAAPAL